MLKKLVSWMFFVNEYTKVYKALYKCLFKIFGSYLLIVMISNIPKSIQFVKHLMV